MKNVAKMVAFRFTEVDLEQLDELVRLMNARADAEGAWTPCRERTRTHAIRLAVATLLGQFMKARHEADEEERQNRSIARSSRKGKRRPR